MLTHFFETLDLFLEREVAPLANELDTNAILLKNIYHKLVEMGGLKLLIPKEYGGFGGDKKEWAQYNIKMSQYSGALLFLQAQHQYVISKLKQIPRNEKIAELFIQLAATSEGVGICVVAGKNLLNITKSNNTDPLMDGFQITGQLPWVTGYGIFKKIFFGFDLEDDIYFTLLPFENLNQPKGQLSTSSVFETEIFTSTQTTSLTFENWFININDIISSYPLKQNEPLEHPTIYNLAGVANALLELAQQGKYATHPKVQQKLEQLSAELQDYIDKIFTTQNFSSPNAPSWHSIRAMGLVLANRCTNLVRVSNGASCMLKMHPVNRLNKEIWQYMLSGYSETQLEAYLNNL